MSGMVMLVLCTCVLMFFDLLFMVLSAVFFGGAFKPIVWFFRKVKMKISALLHSQDNNLNRRKK